MSIPDRSRFDDDIAQSLSILGAAGNAVLIERNYLLTEQNESLLDGAAKRQEYVEEIEAQNAERLKTIHLQAREAVKLRAALAVRDLELGKLRAQAEQHERRRLEGLTTRPTRCAQAVDLAYDCIIVPVLALERVERRWRRLWASLTDEGTKHDSWGAPIAAGICVAIFLIVALAVGK